MLDAITYEAAIKALDAGAKKARELNQPSSLAIVDAGGHLIAFARTEGTAFGTIDIAHNKAHTAAAFRQPTTTWVELVLPSGPLHGFESSTTGRPIVVFPGGLPVRIRGEVVGGVGVSGGPNEVDEAVAQAMAAALEQP